MKYAGLNSDLDISIFQYSAASRASTLHENALHVWQADLQQRETDLLDNLSEDEIARANRFHFDRDRRRYLVARGTLRKLLGGYLGCEPSSLHFAYGAQGKPYLASAPDMPKLDSQTLHFNITHSAESALLAFAYQEVGIDIEVIAENVDIELIAPSVFSPSELVAWQALPASEKRSAFFSLWTRKEALVKAFGRGIGYPLTEVSVNFSSHPPQQIALVCQLYAEAATRSIWEIPVAAGFRAALAV